MRREPGSRASGRPGGPAGLAGPALASAAGGIAAGLLWAGGGADGRLLWYVTRASGIVSFIALTLSVAVGVLFAGRAVAGAPRRVVLELHRSVSLTALAFLGLHVAAILADGPPWSLAAVLVPLAAPEDPGGVAAGILAAYALMLAVLAFWARRRLGAGTWRKVHGIAYGGFVLAWVHGVAAGSDAGEPLMRALYAASLTFVALLSVYRALVRGGEGGKRPWPSERSSSPPPR